MYLGLRRKIRANNIDFGVSYIKWYLKPWERKCRRNFQGERIE